MEKSKTHILIFILFLGFIIPSFAQKSETTTEQIFPGIIRERIINKEDKLVINILQIDLKSNRYEIEAMKANNFLKSKETTSEMSKRISNDGHKVIAAINADFWDNDGEIINNMISNGTFIKAIANHSDDKLNRIFSQFALTTNNKPLIEKFNFEGKLFLKNGTIEKVNRINSKTDSSSITLYNFYQGNKTPKIHNGWHEFDVDLQPLAKNSDTLIFIATDKFLNQDQNEIPQNGFVLSASNNIADKLEKEISTGDTVKALLQLFPDEGNIFTLTGGLPQIVLDGKNLAAESDTLEGTKPSFTVTKHPRTGIGFSKDSTMLYFFTVDGRQESSSGMSLKEFANLMIDHSVYQGLNLDGGGSTTMVINGKLVNHPSDITGERPVGSCLLVIMKN
ncbi:MAG: phosphodiester glycosidase family protein [Bacteroidetes bacterium]|nr:phosphodiester glycosidase family protein [Bacteroidota bacterium]